MVIPELIRLLTAGGMSFDDAVAQVEKTCAYTNHTNSGRGTGKVADGISADGGARAGAHHPGAGPPRPAAQRRPAVAIIDQWDRVHMAHMDIHYGHSVNGVAALHTEILKTSELKPFCDLYPEKFQQTRQTASPSGAGCRPATRRWPAGSPLASGTAGPGTPPAWKQLLGLCRGTRTALPRCWKSNSTTNAACQRLLAQRQGVQVDEKLHL